MIGQTGLAALLAQMDPVLHPATYVFCTVPGRQSPAGIDPLMTFHEAEGMTLIVEADAASAAGLEGTFPCRMITLRVHSSLSAVGFLAAITTELARAEISANPVSGYFHDHVFVAADRAEQALGVLLEMSRRAT